jgi:putative ABC transport system permease protein
MRAVPELWADLKYRLRALFRRGEMERELSEELRFHLEREADKYERAGIPREEAVRRARLAFGAVDAAKEESRDARGTVLLETLVRDARYALRGLRARPGFTLGVVLTLGLGIGANAAMFGIVDRLLFRPPAFLRDADRVHRVYLSWIQDGRPAIQRGMEFARFLDFRRDATSFDELAAFQSRRLPIGTGEAAREHFVGVVSATFFRFFDAPPALGRYFGEDEDRIPEGKQVVVLSYPFWQTMYGGRREVLGTQLQIDRMSCTIIGVAPEGFVGVGDRDVPAVYVPITAYAFALRGPVYPTMRRWSWMELMVRRKPDVSLERATADLSTALQRSWAADLENAARQPIESARPRAILASVQFARGPQAGDDSKVATWVSGVALIVLLIACANVANLLLSRAVTRRRELALRLALGVSRGRLMRQLFTESVVLAVAGGVAGLAIAEWGGTTLRALFLPPEAAAGVLGDARTLLFALAATLGAALLTGFLPAVQASRAEPARALNAGGRDSGGRRSRARTLLLLLQATLSVVLLVGAGLFVRSLHNVQAMRLGYDVDPVVFVEGNLRGTKLTQVEGMALDLRLAEAARAIPGVVAATPTASVPFWSNEGRGLWVPGVDSVRKLGRFLLQTGSPDYFRTVGTRILRGRAFDDHDVPTSARVLVVGEGMAKALWPGADPLGKCVRIGADTAPCSTVIGVAEDMRLRSLTDEREFSYYRPISQHDAAEGGLFVRVAGDAADYAELVRRTLQPLMPGTAYLTAVPLRTLVDPQMRSWRFAATMFAAFGGLALALAGIGLYSVIAYSVAQRRQEIGVRIALGAPRGRIVRLVVGSGMRVVVTGVVLGGALALWAGRWVAALLFHESAADPAVYIVVAAVLAGVALVATALPALAASRVDPNLALRAD